MSLHFVILSFDRYSRDDVIGEVVCPLSGIDLSQIENQQVALSKEIQPRSLKVILKMIEKLRGNYCKIKKIRRERRSESPSLKANF